MEENFEMLLDNDEEIKWCNSVNKSSYILNGLFTGGLLSAIIGLFFGVFIGGPTSAVKEVKSFSEFLPIFFTIAGIIFCIGILITIINNVLNSNNTFFAITNKRIIKRSGSFNTSFVHYSLKNIGNVQINSSLFDKKGNNPSASLYITVKNYHTNTNGNSNLMIKITSLNNVYEAYKMINDLTEGNNESLRVKMEN